MACSLICCAREQTKIPDMGDSAWSVRGCLGTLLLWAAFVLVASVAVGIVVRLVGPMIEGSRGGLLVLLMAGFVIYALRSPRKNH